MQEAKSELQNNTNTKYEIKEIVNWEELPTDIMILRGIYSYGFEKPSPIQSKAILPILDGKDVLAQAQSGTGKTGCFTIGCLGRLDLTKQETQAMILAPTRELSIQIKTVLDAIGSQMKSLKSQLLIGGTSTELDTIQLKNKPHVVIGCPGRIHDMLRRRKLHPNQLKCIILDEADEMLSQGFKEQVYNIFQYLPKEIQVLLFSATMPDILHSLIEKFMRNPIKILVKSEQLTLEGIQQYYVGLENDDEKYETLKDLYKMLSMSQCIIYCNSVRRVQDLHDAMIQDDFPVSQIHSNMDKEQRKKSFTDFSSGKSRVLISSNVTARGIDIQQVSTVINFDIPKCIHTYLHRIGRSGRWGRKGLGINFITKRDIKKLREIETYYNTSITELPASLVNDAATSSC
tara:strand:+ start:173 stop:1378 length:1206 start_codon:yes stop_codon:yes gene_type:complete